MYSLARMLAKSQDRDKKGSYTLVNLDPEPGKNEMSGS
jgi:hypothetical protein